MNKIVTEVMPCPYVLGHITECDDLSEDGGPLWQAEIQTLGGYGVAGTIYAGTEEAARQMAEQAIASWNTRSTAQEPALDDDAEWLRRIAATWRKYGDPDWPRLERIANRLQAKAPETDSLLLYQLRTLAVALHDKHYPEVAQWEPLDDARGLLSQIDNMTTGLVRAPETGEG